MIDYLLAAILLIGMLCMWSVRRTEYWMNEAKEKQIHIGSLERRMNILEQELDRNLKIIRSVSAALKTGL